MRFGFTTKADDPARVKIVRHCVQFLDGRADVVVDEDVAAQLSDSVAATPLRDIKADVMVCVGGDGTILHALQENPSTPVFGINMGELGFLTEIEPIELTDGLERVLAGDYFVEHRGKIATRLNEQHLGDAVNEVAVKTARLAKILMFEIAWGDLETMRLRGDGVIVATPTGSTSYAMSAGGPIVDPRVDCFVIVPLAAFSLASRPMALPTEVALQMQIMQREKEAVDVIDGQSETVMREGDLLTFTASDERAQFLRFRRRFYHRLMSRLG